MMEATLPKRQLLSEPMQALTVAGQIVLGGAVTRGEALLMFATALAMGVLTDVLFFNSGPGIGINVFLWHLALVAGGGLCAVRSHRVIETRRLVLIGGSLVFSLLVAIRASEILQTFNLWAAMGLFTLALALPPRTGLRRIGPLPAVLAFCAGGAALAVGVCRLVAALPWDGVAAGKVRGDAVLGVRALLVATPVFLVFGGLFVAADAVFAEKARGLLVLDIGNLPLHIIAIGAGFWVAAAALWSGLVVEVPADVAADLPETRRLRAVETTVLLLPLALLFLAFVLVQLRYLFGGEEVVLESLDLTYAQYARRGFFELVAASMLLLPLLLAVNWARKQDRTSTLLFRGIGLALIGLLFVVMVSAWQRLSIYMDALGLTELRFYVAVILLWLMIAFVWLAACIVRPGQDIILGGLSAAAVVVLLGVNIVNPSALIASTNTSRLDEGRTFDAVYASGLGGDGVPVLVDRLDRLAPADRCVLAEGLLAAWTSDDDPRAFNLGRYRAQRAVDSHRDELERACDGVGR